MQTRARAKRGADHTAGAPVLLPSGPVPKRTRTAQHGGVIGIVGKDARTYVPEGTILYDPKHPEQLLGVTMAHVNLALGVDEFLIVRAVQLSDPAEHGEFALWTRSGRTGTEGTVHVERFQTELKAILEFKSQVGKMAGTYWDKQMLKSVSEDGFRVIKVDMDAKRACRTALWQYRPDDGEGIRGWRDFASELSSLLEQLYQQSLANTDLGVRIIHIGAAPHVVNFASMTQTSVSVPKLTSAIARKSDEAEPPASRPAPAVEVLRRKAPRAATIRTRAAKPLVPRAMGKRELVIAKPEPALVPPQPDQVKSSTKAKQSVVNKVKEPVDVTSEPALPTSDTVPADLSSEAAPIIPADSAVTLARLDPDSLTVFGGHDVVLNQCNITGSRNNNKMYKIQLLSKDAAFLVWTRWGRVGEPPRASQSKMFGPFETLDAALKTFTKKYFEKTANRWENRMDFQRLSGKYWPVQIDHSTEESTADQESDIKARRKREYLPCSLDSVTKDLIDVIHNQDMMNAALSLFNIDVDRMPLGKLNKAQIKRGVEVLDEIKAALPQPDRAHLSELSSRFYTTIPHSFGRSRPPVICTEQMLQTKYDMCDTLDDMESTKRKLEEQDVLKQEAKTVPHPTDSAYSSLGARLALLDEGLEEYKVIATYFNVTKGQHSGCSLLNVWRVDRELEEARHEPHLSIENRELLWHGTGIEVVAAILSSGLRIMPHSGGRVGRGLYLACEQGKSASYTRGWSGHYACMFLVEAALGKQHEIIQDDPSLRQPPSGFDSVLARGRQAPSRVDPLTIDGRSVGVPQGPPVPSGVSSSFHQDEYVMYDESQVRLRYIVTLKK
jgi:poly [ADP-ribose] polymerase 2/3/4